MCKLEVVKCCCVTLTFLNIFCAVYYVAVVVPARDVVTLERKAAGLRVQQANAHQDFHEIMNTLPSPFEVKAESSPRDDDALPLYLEQHGISEEWLLRGVNHRSVDSPIKRKHDQRAVVWWDYARAIARVGEGDDEEPQRVVIPFSGPRWLPWLAKRTAGAYSTRIPRSSSGLTGRRRSLLIPAADLVDFSLNGTVPIVYDAHKVASVGNQSGVDDWNMSEDDGDNDRNTHGGNQSSSPPPLRKMYHKRDLITILTNVYRLIENPHYSEPLAQAKMQRAFVLAMQALKDSHIKGKEVLVWGTLRQPIVEVALLAIGGAKRVVSVDHHPFNVSDPRIVSISSNEFWRCMGKKRRCPSRFGQEFRLPKHFHVVVAYSTVQHDGLGRYGDRVDPFGDVKLMWELRGLLSPDPSAIVMMGVPLGNDCLVFNRHRVYGRRRLPLLLFGFHVVQVHGMDVPTTVTAPGESGDVNAWGGTLTTSIGSSWAADGRCRGDSQRIPLFVLSAISDVRLIDTVDGGHEDASCEGGRRRRACSGHLAVSPAWTRTWSSVENLAGPYPLYHGGGGGLY